MELGGNYKCFWQICYAIFLVIFIIWLCNAVNTYQSLPTSSKVTYKYGDNGEKMVKFPSVTLCKEPNNIWYNLWRGSSLDVSKTPGEICNLPIGYFPNEPYFLTFMEDCLNTNDNKNVTEILKSISYNYQSHERLSFIYIQTLPKNFTPLGEHPYRHIF